MITKTPPSVSKALRSNLTTLLSPLLECREDLDVRYFSPEGPPICEARGWHARREDYERFVVTDLDGEINVFAACSTGPVPCEVLNPLLYAAARIGEAENDREHLFEELSLSHESLNSIYEITANPDLFLSPDRALAAVLARSVAYEDGLFAILWIMEGPNLIPVQWNTSVPPAQRAVDQGIVGDAIRKRHGVTDNGFRSTARTNDDEPELSSAARVSVAPMQLTTGVLGALEVWHPERGEFNSHFMGLLTILATQAAVILDHSRLRNDIVSSARLRQEMSIASTIQQRLLLGSIPQAHRGLDISALTVPSRYVDGDFYEFFQHRRGVLDVLIGDVMGKGLPAAMVAAAVKSHVLRYASTDGLPGADVVAPDPVRVVNSVHEAISADLVELDCFVTAAFARFDPALRNLTYIDCGHTPTLHYRADHGDITSLRREWSSMINLPLGMHPSTRYQSSDIPLSTGDVVVFYSDGITEAVDPDGGMFGEHALASALARYHHLGAREITTCIRDEVVRFAGVDGVKDDLTCVVVKVLETGDTLGPEFFDLTVPASLDRLAEVRAFVTDCCARTPFLGHDKTATYNIVLAINESVSNIMRHGYVSAEGEILLRARLTEDSLQFEIIDSGREFDPTTMPDPDLSIPAEGGYGVYLTRRIMDEFHYLRTPDSRNCLTLTKHKSPGVERCN